MGLEIITLKEGSRMAERMKVNGMTTVFVRGDKIREQNLIRMIVETHTFGFRRRYSVSVSPEKFYTPGFVEFSGRHHIGHLLFDSIQKEDNFYATLEQALQYELIGEPEYTRIKQKLDDRLKLLHAQIYDGSLLDRRRTLGADLLAAGSAGVVSMLKSSNNVPASIFIAGLAFTAAHLIQKYTKTNAIIRRLHIQADDPDFGPYLAPIPIAHEPKPTY
ncbi:hypothetical protein HYX04_05180 [Candidatus Woesearchaeota archaeon]|nr:hypothetical protein [Candidatus Woesearchaeota archaeon]